MWRSIQAALFGGALTISVCTVATAGPLDEAAAATRRWDSKDAVRILRPLADASDPEAELHLGGLYFVGDGVPQDTALAISWDRKSADQGYPPAFAGLAGTARTSTARAARPNIDFLNIVPLCGSTQVGTGWLGEARRCGQLRGSRPNRKS